MDYITGDQQATVSQSQSCCGQGWHAGVNNIYNKGRRKERRRRWIILDIVLLFGVLYHLPNPIMILQKLFENTDMLLIASHIIDSEELAMYYYPEGSLTSADTTNWWVPTPPCLIDIGTRIGFEKSVLVDTFDFDSINAPLQQDDSVKNGLRRIHKIGLFKMEGRNEVWKSGYMKSESTETQ